MAPRLSWKGYLKLSLVTCAVGMSTAVAGEERIGFRTLNRRTGNPVISRYVDAVTGEPVDENDEVRGYQTGEESSVMLEEDEIGAVALESTRTIDIETFVQQDAIEWIWLDTPHYLFPPDKVGEEAFTVIREAMASTGRVGISRLVLYRRERAIMLELKGKGVVAWTLRYGDEVRDAKDYAAAGSLKEGLTKSLALVRRVIRARTRRWDPSLLQDPVQARLQDLIAAKKKARRRNPKRAPVGHDNVIDIMDALRKSLKNDARKN